jgi:hypothetical protein
MLRTRIPKEHRISTIVIDIFERLVYFKIKTGALKFLLDNKLVTSNFQGLKVGPELSMSPTNFAPEFYQVSQIIPKIILVNIRKKLPLIKKGNLAYTYPFIGFHKRNELMYINLLVERDTKETVMRYLQYIKAMDYIMINNLPLRYEVTDNSILQDGGIKELVRIKVWLDNNRYDAYTGYSIIYLIPQLLKVLSTLHRKAYFTYDSLIPTTQPPISNS